MLKFSKSISGLLTGVILSVAGAAQAAPVVTPTPLPLSVDSLDLSRYQGIWYEIAHFKSRKADFFGKRNAFSRFYLDANDTERLRVVDECDKLVGLKHSKAWAQVFAPNPNRPGELVRAGRNMIGRSYTAPYHVYYIDADYTHAVVGEPTGQYLSIISRTPYMNPLTLTDTIQWISGHTTYANALQRLRCTTQAYQAHNYCQDVLNQLRK
jgi:apolipoprotein D and lipocalin family protein